MAYRDTSITRSALSESVKQRVWGRSAARCVLCSQWLINSEHFLHSTSVGELAHGVAAVAGKKAPRGAAPLDAEERAQEENILLLCHSCHRVVDSEEHRDKYTVEFLKTKKTEHERRVREVTNFATLRRATVLSLHAQIRGTISPASADQISTALLSAGLTGLGADTRNGKFDVTLDQGEQDEWSWVAGQSKVDKVVDRVNETVAAGDISVIAVFAIAPIPILAYLGSRLDDKTEVALFPRQRVDSSSAWTWSGLSAPPTRFAVECGAESAGDDDIAVILNVSGTVNENHLPAALAHAPKLTIMPEKDTPHPDLVHSVVMLNEFAATWRSALATAESRWPNAQRIHIFAAVPTTVAITIGRYRMRDSHPIFVLYQRANSDTYKPVMEITE